MSFKLSLSNSIIGALVLLTSAGTVLSQTSIPNAQYTVVNNCPGTVILQSSGETIATLASGVSITQTLPTNNAGPFVVTTPGQSTISGLEAGFQFPSTYYIAKLQFPVTAGVSITPSSPSSNGFCDTARCDNAACTDALPQPPTGIVNTTPPGHSCPGSGVSYTVTFCPSGSFSS